MSRGDYPQATYQPESVTMSFSFKLTSAGAASLVRGGGGHVASVSNTAGTVTIQLNTPYPPQLLRGEASAELDAGGGAIQDLCEVPQADYNPTTGVLKVYYIHAGSVQNPASNARVNVELDFLRRKALKYA